MTTAKQRLLQSFIKYSDRRWSSVAIKAALADLVSLFNAKCAVRAGGVVTAGGSITASVLQLSTTALDATLNGNLKIQLAAQTNLDLFTTSGAAAQAVFANGATAAAISLATDETAYVTIIAADTDGAGSHTGDNGVVKLIAVVAGIGGGSKTYQNQTAFLTDSAIDAALMASTSVHAGTTGWVRLADILWDENSASPTATITLNRDA